jgi:hypothetical protein
MAENAPRPPLYPNSPKPLLKKPQTPPKCCDKIALTHKFPFCIFNSPLSEFLSIRRTIRSTVGVLTGLVHI